MGDGRAKSHSPDERRMMFVMGFGDGAKASAKKHEGDPDYVEGYARGIKARREVITAFCAEHDLPLGSPLREDS